MHNATIQTNEQKICRLNETRLEWIYLQVKVTHHLSESAHLSIICHSSPWNDTKNKHLLNLRVNKYFHIVSKVNYLNNNYYILIYDYHPYPNSSDVFVEHTLLSDPKLDKLVERLEDDDHWLSIWPCWDATGSVCSKRDCRPAQGWISSCFGSLWGWIWGRHGGPPAGTGVVPSGSTEIPVWTYLGRPENSETIHNLNTIK